MSRGALAIAFLALGCESGPPPYGFDARSERAYEFESRAETTIDDEPVLVLTYAAFRLAAKPLEGGATTELVLYLERYFQSVESKEGLHEVAISNQGVLVRGGEQGELRLAPDDATPSASSVTALLQRPLASAVLDSEGALQGSPFHSHDPLLAEVDPLDWFLLSAPLLSGGDAPAWSGSRELPRIGQYRLGVQLPMRYERLAPEKGRDRIRAEGFARRDSLELVEGFQGALELEYRGQAELGSRTELLAATSELEVTFDASDGSRIHSRQHFAIRCRDCADDVNSEANLPDQVER
jgi:hypothetical protein